MRLIIHNDINLNRFVIPGLTRNPVFSWIPAFAGMTCFVVINDAVYRLQGFLLTIYYKKGLTSKEK